MAVHPPPDYTRITKALSDVANDVDTARRVGGLRKNLTSGQMKRGQAYQDGSRILIQQCRELMDSDDEDNVVLRYNLARDARAALTAGGLSGIGKLLGARKYKRLSKGAYEMAKGASDRALDNKVVGPMDGTDPPAGAPPATPEESAEESDGTDTPARARSATQEEPHGTDLRRTDLAGAPPPVTPEELDRPPPHDPGTESHATLSPGAADIGGPTDEVRDGHSSIYDPDLASSEASIASYKTERTVNSRKSRYNDLPRRKHADSGHLGVTEGIASLNVDDAPVQGVEVPTAGLPLEPFRMTDRAQEADNLSHNSSYGLISLSEVFGADD